MKVLRNALLMLTAALIASPPDANAQESPVPEAFYKKAQNWLDSGEGDAGRLLMKDLAREYPDSPYGKSAQQWLGSHGKLDQSGRVEFIVSSTALGAYLGYTAVLGFTTLNDSLADDEVKTTIWSSVAGAGAGLVGSVLGSMDLNVSEAQARLYWFLGTWGWFNGFFIYDLFRPLWDAPSEALLSGGAGLLLGVGTSFALWDRLDVDAGTAELATGMATYTTYFMTLANFFFAGPEAYRDYETLATLMMLVPANAAFVGGFFLGDHLKWSAGDVRLMELGGALGTLVGGALLATFTPEGDGDTVAKKVTATLALSTAAGIAGAAFILQPWDKQVSKTAQKRPSGLSGLVTFDGEEWNMGTPLPTILPRQIEGKTGIGFEVPVLSIRL